MTIEFGKYWFKLVMINMDNFEIHYDGMIIKELTYIEMKDLTETMSELAEHVKREREKWLEKSTDRSNENDRN